MLDFREIKNDPFPIPEVLGTPPSGDSSENESLYLHCIIIENNVNSKNGDNLKKKKKKKGKKKAPGAFLKINKGFGGELKCTRASFA